MATKIADKGWNLDDVVAYLAKSGAQVEEDNYGQIVIYTGLYEHPDTGALVEPDEGEIDDNGQWTIVSPSDRNDADDAS